MPIALDAYRILASVSDIILLHFVRQISKKPVFYKDVPYPLSFSSFPLSSSQRESNAPVIILVCERAWSLYSSYSFGSQTPTGLTHINKFSIEFMYVFLK